LLIRNRLIVGVRQFQRSQRVAKPLDVEVANVWGERGAT